MATVVGTFGRDVLNGTVGDDTLIGLNGFDSLRGGAGADIMIGGSGRDTYYVDNVGDTVFEESFPADWDFEYDQVLSSVSFSLNGSIGAQNVETLVLTGTAAVNGTGNALQNSITGNNSNNTLSGLGGSDRLFGLGGNDLLFGDSGSDGLDGGTGSDTMQGGTGDDLYFIDSIRDVVIEALGAGTDTILTSRSLSLNIPGSLLNVEDLHLIGAAAARGTGNDLNNVILGNHVSNVLSGLGGNDRLLGNSGRDFLDGGSGNDHLDAGSGNDVLTGGLGADTLDGGPGVDRYDYDLVSETVGDVILRFNHEQHDRINLSDIDANITAVGDQAFTFIGTENFTGAGQIRFIQQDGDTFIEGNVDADLGADFTIRVDPLISFVRTDFFL